MKKLQRFLLIILSIGFLVGPISSANSATIVLDEVTDLGDWKKFYFDDVGSSGSDTYQFTLTSSLSFYVTDAYLIGDRFEIFDGAVSLGQTTFVSGPGGSEEDAQPAYDSGLYSTGEFILGAGFHDIRIVTTLSPFDGGAAYVKLDTSSTAPVPEPATMVLFGIGLLGIAGIGRKKNKNL